MLFLSNQGVVNHKCKIKLHRNGLKSLTLDINQCCMLLKFEGTHQRWFSKLKLLLQVEVRCTQFLLYKSNSINQDVVMLS